MNCCHKLAIFFLPKSKRYCYAMLKAIDHARNPALQGDKLESRADGLRVIRRFERVNRIKFDPFNDTHLDAIYSNAKHEALFRQLSWIFNKNR